MDTNEHTFNDESARLSSLGGRIRDERLRLGLSQQAFAKLLGVHRRTQINYELGERKPDTDYLAALANAQVDVSYVLTGESDFRKLMVLSDLCGHLRAALELDGPEFEAAWDEVKAKVRADVQNFFDDKPAPLQGFHAVKGLLEKCPVVVLNGGDLATLLDQVEFVAEADGVTLSANQKVGALLCLYRKLKMSGGRTLDLATVRQAIQVA